MSARVQLYVYDLSQGMARMLSQNLVGRQIDGIWHTSVVVFGQEYFFGQGIMQSPPGQTHHGVPLQVIPMGETQIPKDIFLDYLNGMKEHWTADKYHLLDNNCNTFSNELCNFLVGKDIPSHITGLPAEFLNTPLGQSLRPMLENMFGPSQLAQGATAASRATGFTGANISPALAGMVGSVAASAQSTPPGATQLQTAQNLRQFNSILSARRAVIVDFTSQTCPPCRVISPEFERLVREHNEQFHQDGMGSGSRSDQSKIVGVKVEVGMAPDISQKYQISATPTFVFFLDGKEFSRFSGANSSELKSNLNFLIYSAYPPHSHSKLRLPTLDSLLGAPVLFTQSTNIDAIFKKLSEFMDQQQELESLKGTTESLRVAMKADKPLSLPNHWDTAIHTLLEKLPIEQQFPLLDIIRLLILDDSARRIFIGQEKGSALMKVLFRYGGGCAKPESLPKAIRLMVLRLACNFFVAPDALQNLLSLTQTISPNNTPYRSITTALLIESLLSPESSVRQAAASLAYNIAIEEAKSRKTSAGIGSSREDEGIHEEWVSELVAAISKALDDEEDDEIVLRLLASLGYLLRFATSSVLQLAVVIGVEEIIGRKASSREDGVKKAKQNGTVDDTVVDKKSKIAKLCTEIVEILTVE